MSLISLIVSYLVSLSCCCILSAVCDLLFSLICCLLFCVSYWCCLLFVVGYVKPIVSYLSSFVSCLFQIFVSYLSLSFICCFYVFVSVICNILFHLVSYLLLPHSNLLSLVCFCLFLFLIDLSLCCQQTLIIWHVISSNISYNNIIHYVFCYHVL